MLHKLNHLQRDALLNACLYRRNDGKLGRKLLRISEASFEALKDLGLALDFDASSGSAFLTNAGLQVRSSLLESASKEVRDQIAFRDRRRKEALAITFRRPSPSTVAAMVPSWARAEAGSAPRT